MVAFETEPVTVFGGAGDDWSDRASVKLVPGLALQPVLQAFVETKLPAGVAGVTGGPKHQMSERRSVRWDAYEKAFRVTYGWAANWRDLRGVSYLAVVEHSPAVEGVFDEKFDVLIRRVGMSGGVTPYGGGAIKDDAFSSVFHGLGWVNLPVPPAIPGKMAAPTGKT
jgi:hypothetical protein